MNKHTTTKLMKLSKHFLWVGLVVFVFTVKNASGQAITNHVASVATNSISIVSPAAVKSTPPPAPTASNLVLVQQKKFKQPVKGTISLQHTSKVVLPNSNSK